MRWSKPIAVLLTLATLLLLITATTSARQFTTDAQHIRAVWAPWIIKLDDNTRVSCTLTIEGSFHSRTITKVSETLLGYVTRAVVNTPGCRSEGLSTGIKAEVLPEALPVHIRYIDFRGVLPAAEPRIRFAGLRSNLLVVPVIGTCRYRGNINGIITGPAGNGINEGAANLTLEEGITISSETAFCPGMRVSGRTPLCPLGEINATTLRLI